MVHVSVFLPDLSQSFTEAGLLIAAVVRIGPLPLFFKYLINEDCIVAFALLISRGDWYIDDGIYPMVKSQTGIFSGPFRSTGPGNCLTLCISSLGKRRANPLLLNFSKKARNFQMIYVISYTPICPWNFSMIFAFLMWIFKKLSM